MTMNSFKGENPEKTDKLDSSIIRQDISDREVKLYDLYLQRILKEYDLNWSRFKIYFGFAAGVFIAMGYVARPYFDKIPPMSAIPVGIWRILFFLSLVGVLFSISWLLVSRDGRKWMLTMNRLLENVEDRILLDKENLGLYTMINSKYSPHRRFGLDISDINRYICDLFIAIYLVIFGLSAYFAWF
jgi:hypothetical protein